MRRLSALVVAAVFVLGFASGASAATCTGNCGVLGANGVVTAPPGSATYNWVSTNLGAFGVSPFALAGNQDGSKYVSTAFSVNAGAELSYYFNYVTSDGSSFADYAWARLLDAADNQVALLFTARTRPTGDIVPGFGLPATSPGVTLVPPSTAIIAANPFWSPLGANSGQCYQGLGQGCGYTGWIQSLYTITTAGTYRLEFGVINWNDQSFDSGLAFSGIAIDGVPIPEPATLVLFGLGLLGAAWTRRRAS
jgi:hypothetical protein